MNDDDIDFQYKAMSSLIRTGARSLIKRIELRADELCETALDMVDDHGVDFNDSIDVLNAAIDDDLAHAIYMSAQRTLTRIAMTTDVWPGDGEDDSEKILHALRSTLDLEEGEE